MIKINNLKNKSRKIVKKYRNKNNNNKKNNNNNKKHLKHKKTVKNVSKNNVKSETKSQKGGEVQNLANFDYEQLSISKYINTQIDWNNSPGIPPKPSCSIS